MDDFRLYWAADNDALGLRVLAYRANDKEDGYFMLLVSPRAELTKSQQVPRDMVFVLDTSGSMRGRRMAQAQSALKYCLANLNPQDRFGVMKFGSRMDVFVPPSATLSVGVGEMVRGGETIIAVLH